MSELKTLLVCHNHPSLHPGGTEIFAYNLFQTLKTRPGVEALFVACTDQLHRERQPGTVFQSIGRTADELLVWTGHFDRFFQSQVDLLGVAPEFERLLADWQPDVVHFHHTLMIGMEMVALARRVLPRARIVLTLHDYYAICANDGQMVTTQGRLCGAAGLDACRRCFPDRDFAQLTLRETFIKAMLSQVDSFVSPSAFLARRYIDWGIPAERIQVIANGLRPAEPAPSRPVQPGGRRDRFAFFGHINPYKGSLVALDAARLLQEEGASFALELNGGSEFQSAEFRARFEAALAAAGPAVGYRGRYAVEDLPKLMQAADWVVVPSVWWENAPLVIQEAQQHRRPVICSDIGGMAEMVADGVDGLHFPVGDGAALARVMRRAMTEPGLWERLVDGIAPPRGIDRSADEHLAFYRAAIPPKAEPAPAQAAIAPAPRKPPRARPGPAASGSLEVAA